MISKHAWKSAHRITIRCIGIGFPHGVKHKDIFNPWEANVAKSQNVSFRAFHVDMAYDAASQQQEVMWPLEHTYRSLEYKRLQLLQQMCVWPLE